MELGPGDVVLVVSKDGVTVDQGPSVSAEVIDVARLVASVLRVACRDAHAGELHTEPLLEVLARLRRRT
jgi:predicted regulator of Ras-like GTPase activity (Roadblock/LC7/MglB family)